MFGFHKHKWVECEHFLLAGSFLIGLETLSHGPHTVITYKCTACGRYYQQTLVGHILAVENSERHKIRAS